MRFHVFCLTRTETAKFGRLRLRRRLCLWLHLRLHLRLRLWLPTWKLTMSCCACSSRLVFVCCFYFLYNFWLGKCFWKHKNTFTLTCSNNTRTHTHTHAQQTAKVVEKVHFFDFSLFFLRFFSAFCVAFSAQRLCRLLVFLFFLLLPTFRKSESSTRTTTVAASCWEYRARVHHVMPSVCLCAKFFAEKKTTTTTITTIR